METYSEEDSKMKKYHFDFKAYNAKFKKQSTATLKRNYKKYNSDYKRIARAELKRRGVTSMPYTKRKTRRATGFGYFGGW